VDEDTLTALVYTHLLETLSVALNAMAMIEPPTENTLRELIELRQKIEEVEVSTAMLLNRSGVSWERMATILGVKRQSLNRRLSRKVVNFEGTPRIVGRIEKDWAAYLAGLQGEVESLMRSKPRETARTHARQILTDQRNASRSGSGLSIDPH
jgi:hypothetical protein